MCQSKRMACCRAANLFGKARRAERPNASTLLFSSTSCSAPGRVHFHRVMLTRATAAGRRLPVWCAGAKPFFGTPSLGSPSIRGRTPAVIHGRRHLADAWPGSSHRAPHARCVDTLQRARLTLITAMETDGNIWVAVRLVRDGALARSKASAQTGRFWLRFFTGPIRFSPSS